MNLKDAPPEAYERLNAAVITARSGVPGEAAFILTNAEVATDGIRPAGSAIYTSILAMTMAGSTITWELEPPVSASDVELTVPVKDPRLATLLRQVFAVMRNNDADMLMAFIKSFTGEQIAGVTGASIEILAACTPGHWAAILREARAWAAEE